MMAISADESLVERAPDPASAERKATPLFSGVFMYFPDALRLVAKLSYDGNEKHNPGEPLHWAKEKSTDHMDCLFRHALDIGKWDTGNKCDHAVAVAWRALANLQRMYELNELAPQPGRGFQAAAGLDSELLR
jgi:hypothetical protein